MYQKGKGREVQGYGIYPSRSRRGRRGIRSLGPPIAGAIRKLWRKERKKTRRLNSGMSRGTTNNKHVDTAHAMSPDTAMPGEDSSIGSPSMPKPTHVQSASNINLSLTQPAQAGFDSPRNGRISGDSLPLSEPTQAQFDRLMNHGRSGRNPPRMAQVQLNATVSGETSTTGAQFVNEPGQVQADRSAAHETPDKYNQLMAQYQTDLSEVHESLGTASPMNGVLPDTLVEDGENDPISQLLAATLYAFPWRDLDFGITSPMNQPPQVQAESLANGANHSTGHQSTAQIQPQSWPEAPMSDGGSHVSLFFDEHAQLRSGTPVSDGGSSVTLVLDDHARVRPGTPVSDGGSDVTLFIEDHAQVRSGTPMSDEGSSMTLHTGEPQFRSGTPMSDDMDDDMSDDTDDDGFEDEVGDEASEVIEDLWEELRDGKVVRLADDAVEDAESDAMFDADDAQTENMDDDINEVSNDVNDASDRSGLGDGRSWTAPLILVISPTQVEAHTLSVESSDANHMRVPDSTQDQLSGTMDGEGTGINNPSLVHPIPLRVQPDFDSVINHVETSANEGDVPRLFVSPSLTSADYLRNHLAGCMLGYALGMGLSSVHMCYLPEIHRRLEQSVALRNSVYYFCFAWHQFYIGNLQDVDESYGYFRASHGIQEELETVLRFAKYGLADRVVTPELLTALTLTERTLKLFNQGKKAHEYARLCKDLIAELWLKRGPPNLNDPLDTAVSNEIHGLLLREGCEVDIDRISDTPWNEALALCAVGRPTTADCHDTDNRPFMMNDYIKLHEYMSRLEPLFVDLMRICENPYGTESLAREVQSRLQSMRDTVLFVSVCSSGGDVERIGHDLRPKVHYYGKRFYLKAVVLAHIFQKMMMHEVVPLQLVYEMSYVIGVSPGDFLKYFDNAEYETPEYEAWTRIPQEMLDYAERAVRHVEPRCPMPMLRQGIHVAFLDDDYLMPYGAIVWSPVDNRRLLNMPFCNLYKLSLHSSLHHCYKL